MFRANRNVILKMIRNFIMKNILGDNNLPLKLGNLLCESWMKKLHTTLWQIWLKGFLIIALWSPLLRPVYQRLITCLSQISYIQNLLHKQLSPHFSKVFADHIHQCEQTRQKSFCWCSHWSWMTRDFSKCPASNSSTSSPLRHKTIEKDRENSTGKEML